MSAAFTPVPWARRELATFTSIEADVRGMKRAIARIPHVSWMTADVARANANLVAAAPYLYAALETLLSGTSKLHPLAEHLARKTLAQARGETL